jgi:HD-GYP domain-containing protein (c-di-GMP phosphodiesterase class II)
MPEAEVERSGSPALLHDLGRTAVPNGDLGEGRAAHPGRVGAGPAARLPHRAHPAARAGARALAPVAGMHHERLDGSGYHRQLAGPAIPLPARMLAAADAFRP